MNKVCQSCPARVMAKRRVDSISVKCHEACVILSEEHDVSKGRLHPRCPVVAYLRRVAKEIELP